MCDRGRYKPHSGCLIDLVLGRKDPLEMFRVYTGREGTDYYECDSK